MTRKKGHITIVGRKKERHKEGRKERKIESIRNESIGKKQQKLFQITRKVSN